MCEEKGEDENVGKMSHLHKEKERLRHQKQVKLLNKVMEYVPKSPNEPQTKVRKLRRLVLYAHYLQIIHSKLTRGLRMVDLRMYSRAADATADIKCTEDAAVKCVSEPIKVRHQPKRKYKAHIVFLHAVKSKSTNCSINALKPDEPPSPDQESTSVSPPNYEYKPPDVVALGDRVNAFVNQEGTFTLENADCMRMIIDYPVSSNNCEVSSNSIIHNNEKTYNDLDSILSSKNVCYKEKEHFLPIAAADSGILNSNTKEFTEEYSLYDVDKFAQSTVIKDENLRASKHKLDKLHTPSKYDNDISESYEFSNVGNKNFKIPQLSNSDKGKECLLNSYESDSIQNFTSGYSFPTKHFQNSFSCCNSWYNPNFSLNSKSRQPIYCNQSSMIENTSNYSSSSTSTNKINTDIENLSDSNASCDISDSSNSAQYNYYNSCINTGYNPLNNVTKFEPVEEMNSDTLFPPNFSCIGNNGILMNEALYGHMYDTTMPRFGSIYPSRMNFSSSPNCSAAFQPDSIHVFSNGVGELETFKDSDFLYSPSLYDSIHSEQLPLPTLKPKVTNFNYPSESFAGESLQTHFFEEEISYPLAQFMSY